MEINNKMKIKRKIFIIVAIVVLVSIIVGVSYALWSVTKIQTDNNLVTAGCFDVDYEEITDAITLSSALPITDAEGLETSPYTFELTNTCNITASYQINVEVLPVDSGQSKLSDEHVKIDIDNITSILSSNPEVGTTIAGASKSYTIKSGILGNGESQTFNYRQWLDYATTTAQGSNKQFKSKITIVAVATTSPAVMAEESLTPPTDIDFFWGGPITRDTVETIEFTTTSAVPAGVIGSWDVSEEQNGKVMAWYTDTDSNSMYEVTVGANGGVYAPQNSAYLFAQLWNLNTLDLTNLDTSKVTDMKEMFSYAGYLGSTFTINLGDKFDTGKVTDMSGMFSQTGYVSSTLTLDLGDKFDTTNVTDMSDMFHGFGQNSNIFTLNLGNKFDTSNVTNMNSMFYSVGMTNGTFNLDLGDKFNTSNVVNMSQMFTNVGFSNPNFILDLRDFDINAVTLVDVNALATGKTTHTLYTSSSNISFLSSKGFTGFVTNCTTAPASCP